MDLVVEQICHQSGWLRVLIVKRSSGFFGFEEEYWSNEPREQTWCPVYQSSFGIFEDAEVAEREARTRVEWLRDIQE